MFVCGRVPQIAVYEKDETLQSLLSRQMPGTELRGGEKALEPLRD